MHLSKRVCRINSTMGEFLCFGIPRGRSNGRQFNDSRTGVIYNVTPRAVGVIVNKVVGNRYIEKRVNIRVEHVRHSKCRQDFLDRVKKNAELTTESKKTGGESNKQTRYLSSSNCHTFFQRKCRSDVSPFSLVHHTPSPPLPIFLRR